VEKLEVQIQMGVFCKNAVSKNLAEYQTVPCINNSGETFAIWFNVLYLTSLTVLFLPFFVNSDFDPPKA
jgi:hypothetical protein